MPESSNTPENQNLLTLKQEVSEKILGDPEKIEFFSLSRERVKEWVQGLLFNDDDEFRPSPGYLSAGWGHNQTEASMLEVSDIGPALNNMVHETGHGLHNLACQTLFEGPDALDSLTFFKENVLGDKGFVEQIDKPGGSPLQEKMLKEVRDLFAKENASKEDVGRIAWMLGALTYQHAYYVDAGMCEAAASLNDEGVTRIVDEYNQWFAKLLLPGEQYYEGYANKEWQAMFENADLLHKALLVKKADYNRGEYFT